MSNVSFRRFYLPLLSVILLSLGAWRAEKWAEAHFRPISFDPKIKHLIQREHPNVICVGNSMLGSNIIQSQFEAELSEKLGFPVNSTFLVGGGLHSAWQYLVLKNQIATAAKPGTPVLFFDYEDYYVRPEANTTSTGQSDVEYRQSMLKEEPIFRAKIGSNGNYFASGFPYLYSQRFQIKRNIVSRFTNGMLKITGIAKRIDSRLYRRQDEGSLAWLLSTVFRGSQFRGGQADDRERNDRLLFTGASDDEFNKKADASFLPELFEFENQFPLTFVESSSNPTMHLVKQSIPLFSSRLGNYITRHGVNYVDMNKVEAVQARGLMHDSRHFTAGRGREVNTHEVVNQLMQTNFPKEMLQNYSKK